jgi:hypothetical protein
MIPDFSQFVRDVWDQQPSLIILFVLACVILCLLIVDTHHLRKHRKERHRIRHFH